MHTYTHVLTQSHTHTHTHTHAHMHTCTCTQTHTRTVICMFVGPELFVKVVNKTANSVTLRWDIPQNLHKYYKVMSKFCVRPWKIDANNMYKKMTELCVSQNNLSYIYVYTYRNLEPDTKYIFNVYGYMDDHRGPLNNKTVTTDPGIYIHRYLFTYYVCKQNMCNRRNILYM